MMRFGTALVAICLLTLGSPAVAGSGISWLTDASRATGTAAESGKPLLVDIWAVWCEPCKLMEQTTYRDERVLRAVEAFVPLKVDADANEVFIERYEVDAFPTTLFLDGEGREITRLLSLIETDALLATMERVRDGYASYLDAMEREDDPAAQRGAAEYLMRAGNAGRAAGLLKDAAKAAEGEAAERIELLLADALIADERIGSAVKVLKRLATSSTTKAVRGDALIALVRAERQRGKSAKAEEALALLRQEFPERVPEVAPGS